MEFTAPDLIDVETVAVRRKRWLARMIRRAHELRPNVTAYDVTYVVLAEALDCELLTGDTRLAAATGPRCAICTLS